MGNLIMEWIKAWWRRMCGLDAVETVEPEADELPPGSVLPFPQQTPVGLTTDPKDPGLRETRTDGQQLKYLVLSDEERAKGFVRPVRRTYRHVGIRPQGRTRPLTTEEQKNYADCGYVLYEEYELPRGSVVGRYWTQAQLDSGCGQTTTMGQAIAETWARDINYYGATFCVSCGRHLPVAEFIWCDPVTGAATTEVLGS